MPRAHTEEEVERIKRTLIEKGRDRFIRLGLARTTISDLAEDAAIGKGSFYRFFPSKEELFLEIARVEETNFREALLRDLEGSSRRDLVLGLLEAPSTRMREHPFLRLLVEPDTIAELVLRLGAERMKAEQDGDRKFVVELTKGWRKAGILHKSITSDEVFAGLSGLFLIELGRHLMKKADGERALGTIRQALVDKWTNTTAGDGAKRKNRKG